MEMIRNNRITKIDYLRTRISNDIGNVKYIFNYNVSDYWMDAVCFVHECDGLLTFLCVDVCLGIRHVV